MIHNSKLPLLFQIEIEHKSNEHTKNQSQDYDHCCENCCTQTNWRFLVVNLSDCLLSWCACIIQMSQISGIVCRVQYVDILRNQVGAYGIALLSGRR